MSVVWIRNNNTWKQSSIYVRVGGVWKLCTIPTLYTTELVIHILSANNNTAANQNVNVQQLFERTYPNSWSSNVSKRLIIDSGAVIGATDTSNYALNIPGAFSGSVKVDNNGSIQGAGGVGSDVQGGVAIFAGAAGITINNLGTIYAGGGSGGTGGTGGAGSYTATTSTQSCGGTPPECPSGYSSTDTSSGGCCQTYNYCCGLFNCGCTACSQYIQYRTCSAIILTLGGVGGNGGPGQGYNQSAGAGATGFDGGTNAGQGGPGGTGGAFGASGGNGFVGANGTAGTAPVLGDAGGPGYGGLAGYYIVNNDNVTWITTGTVAGRVA